MLPAAEDIITEVSRGEEAFRQLTWQSDHEASGP